MSFMECTLVVTAGWCSSLASKLAGSPKNEPFRWQKWPIVSESANRNHSPDHRLSRTRHRYASNQLSYLDIVQSRRDATTPAFERIMLRIAIKCAVRTENTRSHGANISLGPFNEHQCFFGSQRCKPIYLQHAG